MCVIFQLVGNILWNPYGQQLFAELMALGAKDRIISSNKVKKRIDLIQLCRNSFLSNNSDKKQPQMINIKYRKQTKPKNRTDIHSFILCSSIHSAILLLLLVYIQILLFDIRTLTHTEKKPKSYHTKWPTGRRKGVMDLNFASAY